ncbi:MAG: DUF4277 domain-containing protein [Acidimicrobiales bacterium]
MVVGAVEHGWVAYVANDDARLRLDPAVVIAVVVANIVVSHRPLYGIGEWVSTFEPGLFGLAPGDAQALNDDRVGRMLDCLFDADRATLMTETVLSVVREFQVELGQLHNDATAYRLADGNTPEDPMHIATWESCCVLAGTTMFLYVADAKLCSRSAMGHIDKHHVRFLCVMPATRAEAGEFCRFIARNTPEWTEVARRPGKRKDDPDEVIYSTPAPSPSVEGYRICWFYSTTKELDDAAKRGRSIGAARVALKELSEKLSGPRCRLQDEAQVKAEATAAIEAAGASRWVRAEISTTTLVRHRQQRRGRPGANTAYVRIEEQRYQVRAVITDDVVRDDACFDGCWPTMTNDKHLTETELLAAMKRQPGVEGRHHVFKHVVDLLVRPDPLQAPSPGARLAQRARDRLPGRAGDGPVNGEISVNRHAERKRYGHKRPISAGSNLDDPCPCGSRPSRRARPHLGAARHRRDRHPE